jgi:hypothetical protein
MRRAPIADAFVKQRSSEWITGPVANQQDFYRGQPRLTSPELYQPLDEHSSSKRSSFLPVANPQFLQTSDRFSDHSASRSSIEQASETNGTYVTNGSEHKQNEHSVQRSVNTDYEEEEEEDSDDNKEPVNVPRPPPKDEKWVISSIRRPQQVPVRVQSARMYDSVASPVSEQTSFDQSFSTSAYSEQQPDIRRTSISQMNETRELPPIAIEGNDILENRYKQDEESEIVHNRNSRGPSNLKIAIPGQKRESANAPPQDVPVKNGFMDNVRNQLQHTSPDSESATATRDSMMQMFGRENNMTPGQQQYQGPVPQSQSTHDMNNNQQSRLEGQTMGIRAPPWQQQQSDRQNGHRPNSPEQQPMSQYLTNYPQETQEQENGNMQSSLNRMSSVSGPRLPNQNLSKGSKLPPSELLSMKLATPGQQSHERQEWAGRENGNGRGNLYNTNNGYAYNEGPEPSTTKSNKKGGAMDFANKMKIALKNPTDQRWPENGSPADKMNQRSSLPAEKGSSNKEGKSGRFSLAIFGKKDKEGKKNKEDRDYPISGSSSLGRAGGHQFATTNPRQESLSYPVTANNQTFSSMPDMNPASWQQEPQRGQYGEANDPPRSSQTQQQPPQNNPQSPGSMKRTANLDDGTPVLEYGNVHTF